MEYKIRFELPKDKVSTNPIENEQRREDIHASPETVKTHTRSNDMLGYVAKSAAVYAFGRQAAQQGVAYISTSYNIQGETLKAERLQTKFNNTTNNIGLGLGIVGSIATGNPLVIAATAYTLAQRAFNLANELREYQAQISLERYQAQYYQNRLIKDISEVR